MRVGCWCAVIWCWCAVSGYAAENWFLPYTPSPSTVVLVHADSAADLAASPGATQVTLRGGAQLQPGRFGDAMVLKGAGQFLKVNAGDRLKLTVNEPFTVEMWVRPDSPATAALFSIATRFYFHITPGTKSATFGYRAASFPIRWYALGNVALPLHRWSHLSVTHDSNRVVKVYVNGVFVGETRHDDEGDYAKSRPTAIFGAHDGWSSFFTGALDEIRVSEGVREYAPLLDRRCYLDGEPVKLGVDVASLPPAVHHVAAILRNSAGKVIWKKERQRSEIAQPLCSAADLPSGPARLAVQFIDAAGKDLSTVETETANVTKTMADLRAQTSSALAAAAREPAAMSAMRHQAVKEIGDDIAQRLGVRDVDGASRRVAALEDIVRRSESGEYAYRLRLRQLIRGRTPSGDVRITISFPATADKVADACKWAERLGANEIVATLDGADAAALRAWKAKGYHTVLLGSYPIHDSNWVRSHPDQGQIGWWVTPEQKAAETTLSIHLQPPAWGDAAVDTSRAPETTWMVCDTTTGAVVPAADWHWDKATGNVAISHITAGYGYVVYFTFRFNGLGNPLLTAFADHAISLLKEKLAPYRGVLDTYWFDDLGFAYPGSTPQGQWDWESYMMAAHPDSVARFTQETGIQFDPRWLVMAPRTIDVPPRPEYRAWMTWVQKQMKAWLRRASGVVRDLGMKSWLYWGDCHVGMEPYEGSLSDGGIDQIDKPAADATTARALTDFPGDVFRRCRIDWIFAHTATDPAWAEKLRRHWEDARRGLLMAPIRGIYWMDFSLTANNPDAGIREDQVETMAEIDDEFRLIGEILVSDAGIRGQRAFTHPLNVYVLNAWGKVYSWRPWGDPVLKHLTDLPVNVRFLSFADVRSHGIPADADVILNYGAPGSAWSGGSWWEQPEIAAAVTRFVENGDGLIGIQAPSFCSRPQPHWALAGLLGVNGAATTGFKPATVDASLLADTAGTLPAVQDAGGSVLVQTRAAASQSLTAGLPPHIPGLVDAMPVNVSNGVVLYAYRDAAGKLLPGVVAGTPGKGHVLYLAGNSTDYAFYRLLRRGIFWAAGKLKLSDELDVSGADCYVYAYPKRGILAVTNNGAARAAAVVKVSPAIFAASGTVTVADVVTGESVWHGPAEQLAHGFPVSLPIGCVRLLKVSSAR